MKLSGDLNHELPKPIVDETEGQSNDDQPDQQNTAMVTTPSAYWSSIDMSSEQSLADGGPSNSDASTIRSVGSVAVRQDTLVDTPAVISKRPGLALRPMHSTYVCIKNHLPSWYRPRMRDQIRFTHLIWTFIWSDWKFSIFIV